jgi:hypothetical protein
MVAKRIKLLDEAISELLVADADYESDAETSDVEKEFEEEKEEQQRRRRQQQQQKASVEYKPQAATSGEG